MYELWKLEGERSKIVKAKLRGVYNTIPDAQQAAHEIGAGSYKVCNQTGNVAELQIGGSGGKKA